MKYDEYGQGYTDTKELCDLLYAKPDLNINLFLNNHTQVIIQ